MRAAVKCKDACAETTITQKLLLFMERYPHVLIGLQGFWMPEDAKKKLEYLQNSPW